MSERRGKVFFKLDFKYFTGAVEKGQDKSTFSSLTWKPLEMRCTLDQEEMCIKLETNSQVGNSKKRNACKIHLLQVECRSVKSFMSSS